MPGIQHKDGLLKAVEDLTKIVELKSESGSVIVTEYGARILGVFIRDAVNPFWVSSNLVDVISKKDWNVGGNRLWISPERNFFYRQPDSFEEWFCQKSLDPGSWRIRESNKNNVVLEEELELEDLFNKDRIALFLSRRISAEGIEIKKNLDCIQISVREMIFTDSNVRSSINLWSLTQIRPGGTVLIPVRPKAKPIHYFGKIPRNRLIVSKDHVSFRIDSKAVYKLGIMPEDLPCAGLSQIAYYVEHGMDDAFLISMKTLMAPVSQEECLDVAKADPSGPRGCIQSYNSGPDTGFGEMELHFKPIVMIKNSWVSFADYNIEIFLGKPGEVLRTLKKIIPKPFLF